MGGARRFWIVSVLIYLGGLIAIIAFMQTMRGELIEELSTPEAIAAWQKWKADAANPDGKLGPVERRAPKTDEPPTLVLMRDHYAPILATVLTFYTLLFAFGALVTRGIMRGNAKR